MPSSKLDIWNMAISHLGESIEINSPTENTAMAKACRRFYDPAREKTLTDAPWPFAKKYVLLQQITTTIPISEFQYAYRYPSNALMLRRILNGVLRVEDMQSRIPFRLMSDDQGKIILCDVQPVAVATDPTQSVPWAEYTDNITDESQFNSDFVVALSYYLASMMSPRIAGDKSKLQMTALELYGQAIRKAQIMALNEEARDEEALSEFERAREGISTSIATPLNTLFPSNFNITN